MSNVKISELPAATSVNTAAQFPESTGSTTYKMTYEQIYKDILNRVYPVGAIFISSSSALSTAAQVGAALGGTWVAINAGRAIVGYNSADGDFNALGKEGGAKTVTLTTAQMPAHTHKTTQFSTTLGSQLQGSGTVASWAMNRTEDKESTSTGGGGAHNNLSPYTVRYIFQRTA